MSWTRASYEALYDWPSQPQRPRVRAVLQADGLHDVVSRLDNASNLRIWYAITCQAANAVGIKVVKQSAITAQRQLDAMRELL